MMRFAGRLIAMLPVLLLMTEASAMNSN